MPIRNGFAGLTSLGPPEAPLPGGKGRARPRERSPWISGTHYSVMTFIAPGTPSNYNRDGQQAGARKDSFPAIELETDHGVTYSSQENTQ